MILPQTKYKFIFAVFFLFRLYCCVCELDFDFQSKLDRHSMSAKHKRRKQLLEDNESISETCMDTPLIDYLGTDFSGLEEVSSRHIILKLYIPQIV